jgi:hypothetical protein
MARSELPGVGEQKRLYPGFNAAEDKMFSYLSVADSENLAAV